VSARAVADGRRWAAGRATPGLTQAMPCAAVASSPIVRSLSSQPALHAQLHWQAGVAAAQTRACSELQMASAYHSACGSPGQRCARPATQHSTQRGGGQGGLSKALTRPMPLAVPPGCSVSPLSETRRGAAAHIEVQLVLVARRGVRSTHHVGCRELQCNSQSVFGEGSALCRWILQLHTIVLRIHSCRAATVLLHRKTTDVAQPLPTPP